MSGRKSSLYKKREEVVKSEELKRGSMGENMYSPLKSQSYGRAGDM